VTNADVVVSIRGDVKSVVADGHIGIAGLGYEGWSPKIVQRILSDGQIVATGNGSHCVQPNGGVVLRKRRGILHRPVAHSRVVQPALKFSGLQAKCSQRCVSAGITHIYSIQLVETNGHDRVIIKLLDIILSSMRLQMQQALE
jgi:hypothetical protein